MALLNGDHCWEINLQCSDDGSAQVPGAETGGGEPGARPPPDLGAADSGLTLASPPALMPRFRPREISLARPPRPNHLDPQMKAPIKVPGIAIN